MDSGVEVWERVGELLHRRVIVVAGHVFGSRRVGRADGIRHIVVQEREGLASWALRVGVSVAVHMGVHVIVADAVGLETLSWVLGNERARRRSRVGSEEGGCQWAQGCG